MTESTATDTWTKQDVLELIIGEGAAESSDYSEAEDIADLIDATVDDPDDIADDEIREIRATVCPRTRLILTFDPFEGGEDDGTGRPITADEAQRLNEHFGAAVERHLPHQAWEFLAEQDVDTHVRAYNRPYTPAAREVPSAVIESIYESAWESFGEAEETR